MTAIIAHPDYLKHLTGEGHPERPERYTAIVEALEVAGLKTDKNTLIPEPATAADLLRCHNGHYIHALSRQISEIQTADEIQTLCTGDTTICKDSMEVALLAAGGAIRAVDAVMSSECSNAFVVCRPPGHHACFDGGMGFCLFNNVAIAARYVQRRFGLKRVAIVDWDVHHGNGTQDIFYKDPSVLFFSTHRAHFYPEGWGESEQIGAEDAKGTTINVPIETFPSPREQILAAFNNRLPALLAEFEPEFIFISAGFDAHWRDPLGGFDMRDEDYAQLTDLIARLADRYAHGRLVSVLEGGYDLQALRDASVAHVRVLQSHSRTERDAESESSD